MMLSAYCERTVTETELMDFIMLSFLLVALIYHRQKKYNTLQWKDHVALDCYSEKYQK